MAICASFPMLAHMLKPYEKSVHNHSSAKLELLALKWSVCKKF